MSVEIVNAVDSQTSSEDDYVMHTTRIMVTRVGQGRCHTAVTLIQALIAPVVSKFRREHLCSKVH
jgi:hypothetical protein